MLVADVRFLEVFHRRYLRSIDEIGWSGYKNELKFRMLVRIYYIKPFRTNLTTDHAPWVSCRRINTMIIKKKRRRKCAELASEVSSFILHLRFIGCPSMFLILLYAGCYPVYQTEIKDWLRRPCLESLTKCSNRQGKGRPEGHLTGTGYWLSTSYTLRMGLGILGAKCTLSPLMLVSILSYVSFAVRGWFGIWV